MTACEVLGAEADEPALVDGLDWGIAHSAALICKPSRPFCISPSCRLVCPSLCDAGEVLEERKGTVTADSLGTEEVGSLGCLKTSGSDG